MSQFGRKYIFFKTMCKQKMQIFVGYVFVKGMEKKNYVNSGNSARKESIFFTQIFVQSTIFFHTFIVHQALRKCDPGISKKKAFSHWVHYLGFKGRGAQNPGDILICSILRLFPRDLLQIIFENVFLFFFFKPIFLLWL